MTLTAAEAEARNRRRDEVGRPLAPAGYGKRTHTLGRVDSEAHPDFPAQLFDIDEARDTEKLLKAQQASLKPGQPGYMGQVFFDNDDIKHRKEKMYMQEEAKFMKFIQDNHPRQTYADVLQFKKIEPDWYEIRIATFKEKMDLLTRLGIMKIVGIWTRADWELMYNILAGKLKVPAGFHTILYDETWNDKGVRDGKSVIPPLFSFERFTTGAETNYTIATTNMRNFATVKIPGFDPEAAFASMWDSQKGDKGGLWNTVMPTFGDTASLDEAMKDPYMWGRTTETFAKPRGEPYGDVKGK